MTTLKRLSAVFLMVVAATVAAAQEKPYFVDGFHGGVYGHYPLRTYTGYMMELLDENPDWKMCLEIEPETWDSVKVVTPEDYRRFRDEVMKSDRVEYTNPAYAQPYCYNISGESIIRQFEYGIRKLKEHFPDITFDTYATEEPCFTSSLPAILKGFGFSYASTKCPNTCWGGYAAPTGGELINWIGPDGTSILTSPRYDIEDLGPKVWTTIANDNSEEYVKACRAAGFKHVIGMCYQDAGWYFGPWLSCEITEGAVDSDYVTWTEYFEEVADDVTPEDYVFSQEDVRGALMWGTQVMQRIGQAVRVSELSVTGAEKMGVMANLSNSYSYDPEDMDEAWRRLLLSQHHDSWIVPFNRLKGDGSWEDWILDEWCPGADRIAAGVVKDAKASFVRDARGYSPVVRVFNTMGVPREEVVTVSVPYDMRGCKLTLFDKDGCMVESWNGISEGENVLMFKASVPAFGYTTYKIEKEVSSAPSAMSSSKATVLENSMYRIEVDPKKGGTIKSIVDKKNGRREVVGKDEFAFGEIRGHFYDLGRFCSSAESQAVVRIVSDNPYEKTLRIMGFVDSHPFTQDITIREGDPKIYFDLKIDWRSNVGIGEYRQKDAYDNPERTIYDEKYRVNMYFPVRGNSQKLYKQAPFDVCESRQVSTRFSNWHDIKHNVILGWVDLQSEDGSNFSLFSDHTTAYAYGPDTPLALAVQASGNGLWGRDYKVEGPTELSFCIMPHGNGWDYAGVEYGKWTEPLSCVIQNEGAADLSASFMDLSRTPYSISAAHLTEGGTLLRLFNESPADASEVVLVADSFDAVFEVDLNGNIIREIQMTQVDGMKGFEAEIVSLGFKTYMLKKEESPASYVNPMIGASTSIGAAGIYHGLGKTFPGATSPFGMVQASPQTITGGDNAPGYSDEHRTIEGFSMTQMSGTGWYGDFGNFMVMPTVGEMYTVAGREDGSIKGWRSVYDKSSECARAGYYGVYLEDYGIKAEATATHRCGLLRFTYPESDKARIQVDLARRVGGTSDRQYIRVIDENTISGWMQCTPECGGWGNGDGKSDYTVYFHATFDKPMADYGFWSADIPDTWSRRNGDVVSDEYIKRVSEAEIIRGLDEIEGKHIGFFTEFATEEGEQVTVKVGISFVDGAGAYRNYHAEVADKSFDDVRLQTWNRWESELGCIDVKGGTEDEKTVFYTALYHTMIDPRIYQDVDGRYVGGDYKIYQSDGTFRKRTIFSGWDVFRSQMPLQTIINPSMIDDLINSLVTLADQSGKEYYERWEIMNSYSGCMLGNPATSVLADAYMKGIRNYDVEKAYQYAKNSSAEFGNDKLGFTPGGLSISHTLEYAYTDWCISELARQLGKEEDAREFAQKGQAYRNVFDNEKGWFRPRQEDGSWVPWKEGAKTEEWYGAIEATPYQQGWFVPHDVDGLVELLGGRENALRELEEFFDKAPADFRWNAYYNHANEPVHLVPFLFNRLDAPWLTQKWTRIICRDAYKNKVEGIVGNEDVGQMSAWYVLAASGIHQACPGDNTFEITSPVFDEVTFNLDRRYASADSFKIIAHDNSPENIYIKKAVLNGVELDKMSIDYSDIVSGSVLELWMTSTPEK